MLSNDHTKLKAARSLCAQVVRNQWSVWLGGPPQMMGGGGRAGEGRRRGEPGGRSKGAGKVHTSMHTSRQDHQQLK